MVKLATLCLRAAALLRSRSGSIAVVYALSALPMAVAVGVGVDYARGMVVRSNMADALDAAALAVGAQTAKPTSCTSNGSDSSNPCFQMQKIAQQFFTANYKPESTTSSAPTVTVTVSGQSVVLSTSTSMPTTFLKAAGILSGKDYSQMTVNTSSTVVWGQTKLWVTLVLDNSGSMSESDSSGSKMDALQAASLKLLTSLQTAAANPGDVQVGIVPFTRSVNMGTGFVNSISIDWREWDAPPVSPGASPNSVIMQGGDAFEAWGPGDGCPFTTSSNGLMSPFGFYCTSGPANSAGNVSTIPASGTYKGYICPGMDSGNYNTDHNDRYYNGCYTSTQVGSTKITVSTGSSATCTPFSSSNCSCSGSGSSKTCKTQKWSHVWVSNAHSTWGGCIADRQMKGKQTMTTSGLSAASAYDYDTSNTLPSSATPDTLFPAENPASCLGATVTPLGYNWTSLSNQINAMSPGGPTNQAIGLEHGFQILTPGAPYSTPTLPANTSRYIILLSDGLNTQDRWYGNGSTANAAIDARMNNACIAAKAAGIVIYTLFVDIGGTSGNSVPLQNCASDSTKYYDLTATSQIDTAFSAIAQQITNLRVSK